MPNSFRTAEITLWMEANTSPPLPDDECAICYDTNREDGTQSLGKSPASAFVRTRDCNHAFCRICLQTWLEGNNTCPMCRRELCNPPIPEQYCTMTAPNIWYYGPRPVNWQPLTFETLNDSALDDDDREEIEGLSGEALTPEDAVELDALDDGTADDDTSEDDLSDLPDLESLDSSEPPTPTEQLTATRVSHNRFLTKVTLGLVLYRTRRERATLHARLVETVRAFENDPRGDRSHVLEAWAAIRSSWEADGRRVLQESVRDRARLRQIWTEVGVGRGGELADELAQLPEAVQSLLVTAWDEVGYDVVQEWTDAFLAHSSAQQRLSLGADLGAETGENSRRLGMELEREDIMDDMQRSAERS